MADISDEVMKNGGEEVLMRKIMASLKEAPLEDIPLLLKIALSTRRTRSIEGKQELGLAILSLLESEGSFDPSNNERIQRLIIYLKHMHLLYSAGESLGCYKIIFYISEEVLPHFLAISGYETGYGYALEILQLLAEISSFADKIPYSERAVGQVIKLLMIRRFQYEGPLYLGLLSLGHVQIFIPENCDEEKINLNLTYLEYLLFTFHRMIKFCPAIVDKYSDKLKILATRYFSLNLFIRRQAIKELAIFCRDCVRYTKKVTMTLSQLLVVKDPTELRIVHAALLSLFSIDTKGKFDITLFLNIENFE
uniref:Uncharacterized protein n=1 Tax=Rhodnius prolixus TaxID=13249 RepID=T1H8Z4_RHOPR